MTLAAAKVRDQILRLLDSSPSDIFQLLLPARTRRPLFLARSKLDSGCRDFQNTTHRAELTDIVGILEWGIDDEVKEIGFTVCISAWLGWAGRVGALAFCRFLACETLGEKETIGLGLFTQNHWCNSVRFLAVLVGSWL